jgi:phosphopantothenoylcysteine decarboxylase/phosphopantothenate--cysteine ligase
MIKGKLIILAVTGGIAAYKSAEIARKLIKSGARVKVVMTKNATEFITPLTMQTLSKNPVITDMFSPHEREEIEHISLSDELDLLLVAPATADIIGKFATGIADDFLSTLFLSVDKPVAVAPAMNKRMYSHRVVQENLARLRDMGVEIIDPGYGELACEAVGYGRLADEEVILKRVADILGKNQDLSKKKIIVTAGPTEEPIDRVRFISNPSSGRLGYALALEAGKRGAEVILIHGPSRLPDPDDIKTIAVRTAEEMRKAVLKHFDSADIVIKAAAVSDFRPKKYVSQKIKKNKGNMTLELERTPDILEELGSKKRKKILVGFAAETENLIVNAKKKIKKKNLDLIVANDVSRSDSGFSSESNKALLIYPGGETRDLPLMSKELLAREIIDCVVKMMKKRRKTADHDG